MMFKIAVLLTVVVAVFTNDVNFVPCPGGYHVPTRVWSDMCTPNMCTLRRGQTFRARAYVTPLERFDELIVNVTAVAAGFPFPIEIPPGYEDACDFLGNEATCPVFPGENHVWELKFPVDPTQLLAPMINVRRKFNFDDLNKHFINYLIIYSFCT